MQNLFIYMSFFHRSGLYKNMSHCNRNIHTLQPCFHGDTVWVGSVWDSLVHFRFILIFLNIKSIELQQIPIIQRLTVICVDNHFEIHEARAVNRCCQLCRQQKGFAPKNISCFAVGECCLSQKQGVIYLKNSFV